MPLAGAGYRDRAPEPVKCLIRACWPAFETSLRTLSQRGRPRKATIASRRCACDPWANGAECKHEYGIRPIRTLARAKYDATVLAVSHREFKELGVKGVRKLGKKKHVLYDIKHAFPAADTDGRL